MLSYNILRSSLLILLSLSALIFAVRIILGEIVAYRQKGLVGYKPLGWYSQQELFKADSPQTQKFMRSSNGFSTALWCMLALVAFLALLSYP